MSEETNFLEELEDVLEEAASAESEKLRTPLEDFAFCETWETAPPSGGT